MEKASRPNLSPLRWNAMPAKILILTTEPLPLPGLPATGAGLRAWSLLFGLRSAGFQDAEIAFAADAVRGKDVSLGAVPGVSTFERGSIDDFVRSKSPDAVVLQHWGLFREFRQPLPCPLAMDLAGPHLLERRLCGSTNTEGDLREKITALSRTDYVVCSGQFQRHYFLPFLVQAGWNAQSSLCPVIPFSVSPGLPEASEERDHSSFLYGGMFLPWQDPSATLRTIVEVLEEKGRGKLVFVGGAHPGGDVSRGRFDEIQERLSKSPHVEFLPVMPFEEYLGVLRRCGVAVDLMTPNLERELAFPTRTVTYMWAGLPVIHNDYDELAEPIAASKSGWTFNHEDQDGVRKLVTRLLGHREDVERRSKNAQDLVRANYTWDRTIGPLAKWCADPQRREKPAQAAVPVEVTHDRIPESTKTRKRKSPGRVSYSPPTPLTDTTRGPWYLSPVVFLLALPISAVLIFLFGLAEIAKFVVSGRRR